MSREPSEEGLSKEESRESPKKTSNNKRFEWIWKDSPITRILEKFAFGIVLVFCAYLITAIFINPDFYISPSVPSVTIKTQLNDSLIVTQQLDINANDVYDWAGFKKYQYPIFICCDIVDDQGKPIEVPEIDVKISPKNINTSERANVVINLKNQSIQRDAVHLRFHGRGCGERIILKEGPFSTLQLSPSGIEPVRNCTVTLEIEHSEVNKQTNVLNDTNKSSKYAKLLGIE